MPLKKELQEILDELEFDNEEEKAAFEKVMAGKAGAKIEAGYMKARDYTTKTQALATAKKQLEAEQQKWNEEQDSYLQTMTGYKKDMEDRLNKALQTISQQKLYGAALETKLSQVAAQFGEDPETLLADVKQLRAKETEERKTPAYDDEEFKKKYVPREEYESATQSVFGFAPMLRDLDHEYQDLYGKPYKGSMQQLVQKGIIEVNQRRARGQKVDLYEYMRTELDFEGQKARNAEAAATQSEADKKKWQEEQRAEIEKQVRSEFLASNPAAARQPENTEDWRKNLTASKRKEAQNDQGSKTAQETFQRRQEIHKAFQERQAKSEGAAA